MSKYRANVGVNVAKIEGFPDKTQNKDDRLIKELSELIYNYNTDREEQAILMRNSNEIDPPPSENRGVRVGEGNPHKLYNNFSKRQYVK